MEQSVRACRQELKEKGEQLGQAVTHRKQTLGRALRELKELGRRKDAFLSSISHELRTPITVMQSAAEILAADDSAPARAEFLPGVREHARALDRLVDNLLCLLELDALEKLSKPRPSTLGRIVGGALAQVEGERARREVTIVREVDGDLPVRWDLALTVRLLRELLLNAVRFSPPGGTVRLAAHPVGSRLQITVRDEGPGIPADQCEEIFQRFHQLGDVLTEKPRGTGLGLPICRAIAVRHGGWVRAEPRRDQEAGASLVLELPADAFVEASAEETSPHVLASSPR
jgi:signal transduction histidine kinase